MDALKTINEIRNGNIKELYVLSGENDFLKERIIFWLRLQTGAEIVRIDGENADLLHSLSSYSLFSPRRIIVVELPSKKALRDRMLKEIKMGFLNGIVVVIGDVELPQAQSVECKPLPKKEAVGWIIAEFKVNGVKCDASMASQLLDSCDNDLWAAYTEIEKLSLITDVVTPADLESYVVGSLLTGNYFTLMEALEKPDRKRVEVELNNLLQQGEAFQQIFVFLYRIFSLAWKSKELNMSASALAQEGGRSPYFVMRCAQIGRNFSLQELRTIISTFFSLDLKMKLGQIDESTATEELISVLFPREKGGALLQL
ncbi:DNA polymerase III subunit delta [Coprothermobacter platensis]|uniref:DNA polymerase III subunit delta n=1 Tax=Coprothermobacter platensis TaxID=108819 RepID=UPI0003685437|nr:hypothetical protein [Coprothermobacter platensis]